MRAEAIGAATVGWAASQARATVAIWVSCGLGGVVEGGEDLSATLGLQVLGRALGPRAVDRRTGPVLAGEEAGGEREVRDGGEAEACGDVLEFTLVGVAGDQVVVGLQSRVRARPTRSEWESDSSSRSGEMLEAAMYRTLPALTSSSSAPMISSTGTSGLSKCV
ncbi:hypothetical protein SALBM311S_10325 [Streptomyces alboniger]